MADESKFYHVETLVNGTWGTFTSEPIEGAEEAAKHLAKVQEFAVSAKHTADEVRLHELTVEELAVEAVKRMPAEERDRIVAEAIQAMEPHEFFRRMRDAREANMHRGWKDREV